MAEIALIEIKKKTLRTKTKYSRYNFYWVCPKNIFKLGLVNSVAFVV